jgi:hypothetical protein
VLPVEQIELDKTNPRIRRFLESYTEEPTYDRIALALDVSAAGDDGNGATTPEKLRNSILTNGGIMQPIIVNKDASGRLTCIEGNTRLYIYRSFITEEVEGDWTMIPAFFTKDSNPRTSMPSVYKRIWSDPARGMLIPRQNISGSCNIASSCRWNGSSPSAVGKHLPSRQIAL